MELKELVAKLEESNSPKPNEMREEVMDTIPEMIPWGEVHKESENKKMTLITEVDEFIFQLNKEN